MSCLTIIGIAFFSIGSTITLLFGVYSILNPVYLISLLTDGCPESSLSGDSLLSIVSTVVIYCVICVNVCRLSNLKL